MKQLKHRTVTGVIWNFLDKSSGHLVSFLVTLLLARILEPKEFGLVAMGAVFFAFSRIVIDSGLRDSLIQKKDATQLDYSTVFYFNLAVGIGLYTLLFLGAPLFAQFFKNPDLVPLIRVLSINIVIYSFSIVQVAILMKELKFRTLFWLRLPTTILSGLIGVIMALNGFAVWALVTQMVLESLTYNLMLWLVSGWRPSLQFDKDTLRFHWHFGSRLLVGEVINVIYRNIFTMIIGRTFAPSLLGIYSRADSFMAVTFNNTTGVIQSVTYPALAGIQDDDARLKAAYRKILITSLLLTVPIYLVFILQSENIISILLTDRWLAAAPVLVVLSYAAVLSPFNSINLMILKVKRRGDLMMRLQMVSKIAFIIIAMFMASLGFDWLIHTNLIGAFLMLFINNYFSTRLIDYSVREQLEDMAPIAIVFGLSWAVVTFGFGQWRIDLRLVELIFSAAISTMVFFGVLFLWRRHWILDMINLLGLSLKRG